MPEARPSEGDVDAALAALSDPDRFRQAESRVARMAPSLQRILAQALSEGGWFEVQQAELLKAATKPDQDERLTAVRTLIAEETRLGMMVGVAVGWELARELDAAVSEGSNTTNDKES